MDVNGKTVIVTGAASGIGRALAIECAVRGASVAAADLDIQGVLHTRTLADEKLGGGSQFTAHQLDVSSLDAWQEFRAEVTSEHETVDGIINNAGVTFAGTVQNTSYAQLEQVMAINFMGMVYGSKEFLPDLLERPEAFIANVSSLFGLFPMKKQSAYCASKYAIRGFTEVLAQELRGTSVLVSCIHPGHIGTNIVKNALRDGNVIDTELSDEEAVGYSKAFKAYGLSPGSAACTILDQLKKGRSKILVGRDAVRGDLLSRFTQRRFVDKTNDAAL